MAPKMKRPASASESSKQAKAAKSKETKGTLNSQIDQWRDGISKDCDNEAAGMGPRNKGKGEKFVRLRSNGGIEAHILDLYDNPPSGESKRAFRTQVVNRLFERRSDGSLFLNTGDILFTQHKQAYEERFKTDKDKLLPRLLFVAKYFSGNIQAFEAAKDADDVFEEMVDGKAYYGFRSISRGTVKATRESLDLDMRTKPNKDTARALADVCEELKWQHFRPTPKETKILDKGHIPPSAKKILKEASAAQDKLCRNALALTSKAEIGADLAKQLKQGHALAQTNQANLQHLLNFNEFADGSSPLTAAKLDEFLLQVATETQRFQRSDPPSHRRPES